MATNEIFKIGAYLDYPVGNNVQSGTPVRIGILNAVATTSSGDREDWGVGNAEGRASVAHVGVFSVPVDLGETPEDDVEPGTAVTWNEAGDGLELGGAGDLFGAIAPVRVPEPGNQAVHISQFTFAAGDSGN